MNKIIDINNLKKIQEEMKEKIIIEYKDINNINFIAGIDVSTNKFSDDAFAGLIVYKFPQMEIIDEIFISDKLSFPYIPGYLAFREAQIILKLLEINKNPLDLLLIDGHGIAHPRSLGIATYVGIMKNIATIGIAKKKLYGEYFDLKNENNSNTYLYDNNKNEIGIVFRNKKDVKPVFISPGYKTNINTIIQLIPYIKGKYRIPIPTRDAHIKINEYRNKYLIKKG